MNSAIMMSDLFQIERLSIPRYFSKNDPFLYLGKGLSQWLAEILDELNVGDTPMVRGKVSPHAYLDGRVYIAEGASVEPSAMISGPCYIGPGSEVRHGAYIRGHVFVGEGCVVGHTTEVKGSIFLDGAKAGHFAYVGDSILGKNVNLGAGTKLANLKFNGKEIMVRHPRDQSLLASGLRKFGALIGDGAQTGCNSVLDPGSVLFPGTAVLPCVHHRGTLTTGVSR
jgi:NDP-sugar pyrophosphorylase family protein